MPIPAVIVELPAGGDTTALAPVLLESCSAHLLAKGGCALADEASLADPGAAQAVAIVSWSSGDAPGGPATAHLQVGVRTGASAAWSARDLSFKSEDAKAERWRAVGLAIASLVGERAARDTVATAPLPQVSPEATAAARPTRTTATKTMPAAAPDPAPRDRDRPASLEAPSVAPATRGATATLREGPRPRPSFWFDGGLSAGPLAGAPAPGVALRGFHRLGEGPLLVMATAAYTQAAVSTAPDVDLARAELGVGAALAASFARDGLLEAHLQALAGRLEARGSDPARGDASASTLSAGASLGGSVGWLFFGPFGAFLGADATARSAGADVKAGATEVARDSPLGWNAVAGARLSLD